MIQRINIRGLVVLALLAGLLTGVGSFTFVYAKGSSYLTNDPAACANCHVMQGNLDAWAKSSHKAVAVCNDCHTPHNLSGKYLVKGINGFNHSFAFTTGRFKEPIGITSLNHRVTEAACRYCHADIVAMIDHYGRGKDELSCVRCHTSVGHLR